jgi:hypothetical protein
VLRARADDPSALYAALPQSLVLRANRAAYTRHLEPEYVCTSLSGA